MKNINKILLGLTLSISAQAELLDDKTIENKQSNLPANLIVYKMKDGSYLQAAEAKRMQLFIKQIQDAVLAADPSPQPSINTSLVANSMSYKLVYDLYKSNINIQVKSTCDLIEEAFLDRRGNLLNPRAQAQDAIDCGCRMIDKGFSVADSQIQANKVYHYGWNCPY